MIIKGRSFVTADEMHNPILCHGLCLQVATCDHKKNHNTQPPTEGKR